MADGPTWTGLFEAERGIRGLFVYGPGDQNKIAELWKDERHGSPISLGNNYWYLPPNCTSEDAGNDTSDIPGRLI